MAWKALDDEGAKVETEARDVVSALMVLDWVEAEVMAIVAMGFRSLRWGRTRCDPLSISGKKML